MGALSLLAKIGLDATAFEIGVKRLQSTGEKFGTNFKAAVTSRLGAALSVAAVTTFAHSVSEAADRVGELAEQLNITTDDVQKLQMAATLYGVKFESVANAILKINDARMEALTAEGPMRESFLNAKFSLDDLKDSATGSEQILITLGERLNADRNNAQLMAAATDLLGLKLVKAAMAAGTIKNIGPIQLFKEDDIKQIEKFNDQMDLLAKTAQVTFLPVIAWLARTFEVLNERIADGTKLLGGGGFAKFFSGLSMGLMSPVFAVEQLFTESKTTTKPGIPGKPGLNLPQEIQEPKPAARFALGGTQDSLARIGGFTGFQSNQNLVIKQAIEQTVQLKAISRNTKRTSEALTE